MKNLFLASLVLMFVSCDKHLNEKVFEGKNVKVRWYRISRITSVHEYVDLEIRHKTYNLLESNSEGVYDIIVKGDTIIIQVVNDLLIYELSAIANGNIIILDSSITSCQYQKKFFPEFATDCNDSIYSIPGKFTRN
ncbi:hypothetical protein KJK34_01860 [Flavobacterium sp. D11R37]|uniref:hypothetical protein n=1 Tax=Flavobacterium coralii TaxID=2838017 RepID=UPI001CA6C1F2|nr:hypothetical protein [Flavobacterium coralii]MBY8961487.1 hypothetical protein [Flavobacterium coralii]